MTFSFEFDDRRARQAMREAWLQEGRRGLDKKTLALIGLGSAIHFWSLATPTSPKWWLAFTGLVPLLTGLTAIYWLFLLWWLPRRAAAKVAHLPHRRVEVTLTPETFGVRTATESMEVAWSEVLGVRQLPSFLVVRLRSGGEIPLLSAAMGESARSRLLAVNTEGQPPATPAPRASK